MSVLYDALFSNMIEYIFDIKTILNLEKAINLNEKKVLANSNIYAELIINNKEQLKSNT